MSEPIKFEYMATDLLTPYEGNARKHGREDVEAIKASIREFGFDDPIGIWGEQNIIVEGHGRLLAAKELGLETVPVIRLDHLTDEQRRAYALAHNRTAELSTWDKGLRDLELESISEIDMTVFGFEIGGAEDERYTGKALVPQYEVQGTAVLPMEMYDSTKADALIEAIESDKELSDEEKAFLKVAAMRHVVFDYAKIAEYYAKSSAACQRHMEKSALVIIDYDDAIANGYVKLKESVKRMGNA